MLTHRITIGWSGGSGNIANSFELAAGAEHNIDETIPIGTDRLVAYVLNVAQAFVLFMVADRDLVVETNSASAPGNVFTLKAGVPFAWAKGGAAMRDTAGTPVVNITALYVTNAGEAPAELRIRSLIDPTV